MTRILITGASGFIGNATIQALAETKLEVHAVYNSAHPSHEKDITWHKADLFDNIQVANLFTQIKPALLIQLAWCTNKGTYWTDHTNLDWVTANLVIARHFVINGGKRCLFAGTSAEYDWSNTLPLNEKTTALNPLQLYGGSKLALYWALIRFFEQESISFAWLRFFNPFGEGEDKFRLIPKTCRRLLNGEMLYFDAASSLRDFLHIDDVAKAIVQVLTSDIQGPINIGSGHPISVRQVISLIAEYYKLSERVSFAAPVDINAVTDAVTADTKRLNIECGWTPDKTLKERLAQTCEWWRHQHIKQTK